MNSERIKELTEARDHLNSRIERELAKAWILENAVMFIASEHKDARENPEITVGQIVAHLDSLEDKVDGYIDLAPHDPLRYQVVRSVVENAAKEGTFTLGTTINARGRESKCFSPANWRPKRRPPTFEVEITGSSDPDIQQKLSAWLMENAPTVTEILAVKTLKPMRPLKSSEIATVMVGRSRVTG